MADKDSTLIGFAGCEYVKCHYLQDGKCSSPGSICKYDKYDRETEKTFEIEELRAQLREIVEEARGVVSQEEAEAFLTKLSQMKEP